MYTRFLFYQILGVTLPFRHVFKVLNDYEAYSQWHLKDTLQLKILRTWIDIRVNSFLDKFHETKMDEDASEIISCTKSEPVLWRTSHQDISLIIIFFFFSETNLNFKLDLLNTGHGRSCIGHGCTCVDSVDSCWPCIGSHWTRVGSSGLVSH